MEGESCFKVTLPTRPTIWSDVGGVLARSWRLQRLQLTEEDGDVRAPLGVHGHHGGQQLSQC